MNERTATYRLQLGGPTTLAAVRALVPYLARLGVSHLYTSPPFRARTGSEHGYDVVDPRSLDSALGSREEWSALATELSAHGMGLILDIVPNHMAASTENPWWADVLTHGPASLSEHFFDITWDSPDGVTTDRLLLPVLGAPYYEVLESGDLTLGMGRNGFVVRYFDSEIPIEPGSYALVLESVDSGAPVAPAPETVRRIVDRARALPSFTNRSPAARALRARESTAIQRELVEACRQEGDVEAYVASVLDAHLAGRSGGGARLDRVLRSQPYRLVFWRMASEHLNYRRFFDVTDLVGVRVEDERVFEVTHGLVFELLERGMVDGVRVDHVDGLRDPGAYLDRLHQGASRFSASPYVLVEKILLEDETLPESWPVAGTTGYDFLNAMNAVFVDEEGVGALDHLYRNLIGDQMSFAKIGHHSKKRVLRSLFSGEVRALAFRLLRLAAEDRYGCDLSYPELAHALVGLTASLPVYRTYFGGSLPAPADSGYLQRSFREARRYRERDTARALAFLERVLRVVATGGPESWRQWVMSWQQLTGPATAKGVEDTALYTYNRLLSLNEVGGDPGHVTDGLPRFHRRNRLHSRRWSESLNASSTHDTKRSEDVRARLNVLSEIPHLWERRVERWRRENKGLKTKEGAPHPNDEYHLYQTLVGVWPLSSTELPTLKRRLKAYAVKALREGKQRSSWYAPDRRYERQVLAFIDAILSRAPANRFLTDFTRFQSRVAFHGALNGLAQVLLKIGSPGVPDFYQGTELWTFTLVDPDNRRPVDYAERSRFLDEALSPTATRPEAIAGMLRSWRDGRVKLYLTARALRFRRSEAALFREGTYLPLKARGRRQRRVCAFLRRRGPTWLLLAVPRLTTHLTRPERMPLGPKVWGRTALEMPAGAPRRWRNVLTEEPVRVAKGHRSIPLARIFERFPVALLVGKSGRGSRKKEEIQVQGTTR